MKTHSWARLRFALRAARQAYRDLRDNNLRARGLRPGLGLRACLRQSVQSEDGFVLAIVAVVAVVAAAGVAAYASYEQGQAQKKAYRYNAKVAENQAAIAKQQQEFAARQQRERDRRLRSIARAKQGATGVEIGEGSSLLVDVENARTAEMNAAAARYTGQAVQSNLIAGSLLSRYQGDVAAQQGTIGAVGHSLAGIGSAAGASYRYSSPSQPPPSSSTQPTSITMPNYTYPASGTDTAFDY